MRYALLTLLAASSLFGTSLSFADVGPPPSCPAGTYRVYLYGHRCVRDGYVLVEDKENGGVKEVALGAKPTEKPTVDGPVVADPTPKPADPTPKPADPAPFATPPSDPPAPAPAEPTNAAPTAAPPAQRGCACTVPGVTQEHLGAAVVLVGAGIALARRSRARKHR